MVTLKWCCKKKGGIALIEPNDNLTLAYIEMAYDSLKVMNNERTKSLRWAISACYYSMYYALYAILMKIGIKSEIHACTLKLMEKILSDLYTKEDVKIINKAFKCRNTIQYYVDKIIDQKDSELIFLKAPFFLTKTEELLAKINQEDIENIREKIIKLTEQ